MKIDSNNFERIAAQGGLKQGLWGDGVETACMMGALVGVAADECTANGWPLWLAQMGLLINDESPAGMLVERGREFYKAVQAAEKRGADFDRVFRDVRLNAILPIAIRSIGVGDEPWRVQCRDVVQWSLDHDGAAAMAADAAWAAWAAWAVGAGGAAWATRAARATWAAGAGGAVAAVGTDEADWDAAVSKIFDALIAALRGEANQAKGSI